jgi:uncharacterized damage-inducible protein DinB
MDMFERMLGFDRWTTARFLDLSRSLTDAQLDQEFDIGHRTLRATFDHINAMLDYWTTAMLSEPAAPNADDRSLDALIARHEREYDRFAALARRLASENRLDEAYLDHYEYPQSFGATILHIVTHNTGHRSEILHIFDRLGLPDLPEADPTEWEHAIGLVPETLE